MSSETESATLYWTNIYSKEITSDECVSEVRALLSCPLKIALARSLRGKEAQKFIDFLDLVLTKSSLDDEFRRRGWLLLSKICKSLTIIPSSYILRKESIHVERVHCYGGSAEVSNGEYMGRSVAIKYLRMNAGESDKVFKRLCREIVGWKHLSHPNILPLLGVSISTNPYRFGILTKWMVNGNAIQYTRSNPEVNRLQLLSEVASGVTYLHQLGIVHGDLKGANILVDTNGTARLADFGLLTILIENSSVPISATAVSHGGTTRWMSPELHLDQSATTRQSDCYALGMVIYEVLTGLKPFHRLGHLRVVIVVQNGERPEKPPNAQSLGFSDTLWELTLRCWNESPSARPTAQQLLRYLRKASRTWVPPAEYPVADGLDSRAGSESTPDGELRGLVATRAKNLFTRFVCCAF